MVVGLWSCLKARCLHNIYIDTQCNVLYLCSAIVFDHTSFSSQLSTAQIFNFILYNRRHYFSDSSSSPLHLYSWSQYYCTKGSTLLLSRLHIGILFLLYSNYLPSLHNTAMDILEKEMEWEILNKSKDTANEQIKFTAVSCWFDDLWNKHFQSIIIIPR